MEISQDIKTLKDDLSKKLDLFNKIRFGDSYKTQDEINSEVDNNKVKKLVIKKEAEKVKQTNEAEEVKEDTSDNKKVIKKNSSSTTKFGTSLFGRTRRR